MQLRILTILTLLGILASGQADCANNPPPQLKVCFENEKGTLVVNQAATEKLKPHLDKVNSRAGAQGQGGVKSTGPNCSAFTYPPCPHKDTEKSRQ